MSPACDESPKLSERVAILETHVNDMKPKIDAMYDVLVQGRVAARIGGAGATLISKGAVGLSGLGIGGILAIKWKAFLIWLGS